MNCCYCGEEHGLVVTNDDRVMCKECWVEAIRPDPNPNEENLLIVCEL